ncbi:uncharacterized protein VTP21DRAFT_2037 [Calcarisporiella thermophila]|uniref:uncharacterized protein n=1 Tax=Calcarisporiella thermophila TaxID=911321 RepID=UPI0037434BB8
MSSTYFDENQTLSNSTMGQDEQDETGRWEDNSSDHGSSFMEAVEEHTSDFLIYREYQPEWETLVDAFGREKQAILAEIQQGTDKLKALEERFETAKADFFHRLTRSYEKLSAELEGRQNTLETERRKFEGERDRMKDVTKFQSEKIKLNVGGLRFETSLTTLRRDPNSMLAAMFSGRHGLVSDADGSYFIDRDGTHFRLILNFLRDLRHPPQLDEVTIDELVREAAFYQINGLLRLKWANLRRITQEELSATYPKHTHNNSTVFKLEKLDCSFLDFSGYRISPNSTFAGSNLEGANFSSATFLIDLVTSTIDFSNTNLMNAKFPVHGSPNRPVGVQFRTDGAMTTDAENLKS